MAILQCSLHYKTTAYCIVASETQNYCACMTQILLACPSDNTIVNVLYFQAVLVHTAETVRIRYFLDLLMGNYRPVMLVGGAGCGKTVLVNDKLSSLREETLITTIPFNHYTTSLMLQGVMEKPLEKKAGLFTLCTA